MNPIKTILPIFLAILLAACAKTYTVPQNLIEENITHSHLSQSGMTLSLLTALTIPIGVTVFDVPENGSSGLKWLPVINGNQDTLEVEITPVSTFIIKTKSNDEIKMLATSAFIEKGYLKGKRSQFLGMAREVPIDSISNIYVYTENSSTREYRGNGK